MRKIIVSMNVTLDGFMSGPNCELDWHFQSWTEDMAESFCEQLSKTDTILFGRVTYKAMAKYWQSKMLDMAFAREDIAFAEMMNRHKKVVFSKTLSDPDWYNSRLIKGDIRKEILKLKQLRGKDMIVYGSGVLVSTLMRLGLIDEYVLWVHPVILGKGKPLFKGLHDRLLLTLQRTKKFSSGVVGLYYAAANKNDKNNHSRMEEYSLKNDIKVFYITAESFPAGILAAHEKLHSLLPSVKNRNFFGISYPDREYNIIYKAAVEESYPGEAEKYGCETFVIRKGEYISETITGWQKDAPMIGKTFEKLLSNTHIDKQGYCLEVYLGEDEMRCMVGMSEK